MNIKLYAVQHFHNLIMYKHYNKQIKLLMEIQDSFKKSSNMDEVYFIEEEIWKINQKIINL